MRALIGASAALVFGVSLAHAADAPKISVEPVARTSTTITGEKIVVPPNPYHLGAISPYRR